MTIPVLYHSYHLPGLKPAFPMQAGIHRIFKTLQQYIPVKWLRLWRSLCLLLPCICQAGFLFASPDTTAFYSLLRSGDSTYKQKMGYSSFLKSLYYFDSANILAENSGDTFLLAKAVFARGRVYDAWNKEPERTKELYARAADLFKKAGDEYNYFYVRHLTAHAYDKIGDSLHATAILREMVKSLSKKNLQALRGMNFIPEMALVATEVHAYALADSILKFLFRRNWIANDPGTYNYLDHYYLTQSRLDIYWQKNKSSLYIDSLYMSFTKINTTYDRLYYATNLAALYSRIQNYHIAYQLRTIEVGLLDKIQAGNDFEQMQRVLVASETSAERRKLAYESTLNQQRASVIWVLVLLLGIITVLSIYLYRRTKIFQAQSVRLQQVNDKLDIQVAKVELLNKEMQHRIKNNLYTIYSLLHMQQDSTDNEEVTAHLETARQRVETVAALHDYLQTGSNQVDFNAYIKELIRKIVSCYAGQRKVMTHLNTQAVSLSLNTYFALSLILNEWITNSVKYAHTKNDLLNINVSISNMDDHVCIDYKDDGLLSFPQHFTPGLGSRIIRLLIAQIKATVTIPEGQLFHYKLCIPHE